MQKFLEYHEKHMTRWVEHDYPKLLTMIQLAPGVRYEFDYSVFLYPLSVISTNKMLRPNVKYRDIIKQKGSFTRGFVPFMFLSASQNLWTDNHKEFVDYASIALLTPLSVWMVRA